MDEHARREEKIMIVDDEKTVRDFLERFLKKVGFSDICTASSGQEALEHLKVEKKDLVFLDIRMPGINGIDTLGRIKEIDKNINVIMITGFAEDHLAAEALKKGAYDYIMKPFDLAYLELSLLSKIALAKR